jgi:hypothetical protein
LALGSLVLALSMVWFEAASGQRLDGFNVIATPYHPIGSASAELCV